MDCVAVGCTAAAPRTGPLSGTGPVTGVAVGVGVAPRGLCGLGMGDCWVVGGRAPQFDPWSRLCMFCAFRQWAWHVSGAWKWWLPPHPVATD